jgi:hypothetical protein
VANSLLTPTAVTREALRVLHQKLNFIGSINRQYDSQYANSGGVGKIGTDLKVRLPNQYVIRSGETMQAQDTIASSTTIQLTSIKGVDLNFSTTELTLSLNDFSRDVLVPAMTVLAANIEADALNMYKDVYNQTNNVGAAATFTQLLNARKKLVDNLTPMEGLAVQLNTQDNADIVTDVKGLFQDGPTLAKQYREGYLGRTAGFSFFENTLLTPFTGGSEVAAASSTISINGSNQVTTSTSNPATTSIGLTVTNGSSKTLKQGDIVTLVGVNRVHPETKADTGALQQFVVAADLATSGTTLYLLPGIVISGPFQNVTAAPTTANAIKKIGVASTPYGISLAYHRDAFAFVTADLIMDPSMGWASRQVMDGISMRIWKQGDIINNKIPCRVDIAYGYKTIRPQLACRLANN